jgi:hypothetical protein
MKQLIRLMMVSVVLCAIGCGVFQEKIVVDPELPFLITDTPEWWQWDKINKVRIAVPDMDTKVLIDGGWVKVNRLLGITGSGYDWTEFDFDLPNE